MRGVMHSERQELAALRRVSDGNTVPPQHCMSRSTQVYSRFVEMEFDCDVFKYMPLQERSPARIEARNATVLNQAADSYLSQHFTAPRRKPIGRPEHGGGF